MNASPFSVQGPRPMPAQAQGSSVGQQMGMGHMSNYGQPQGYGAGQAPFGSARPMQVPGAPRALGDALQTPRSRVTMPAPGAAQQAAPLGARRTEQGLAGAAAPVRSKTTAKKAAKSGTARPRAKLKNK